MVESAAGPRFSNGGGDGEKDLPLKLPLSVGGTIGLGMSLIGGM